MSTSYTVHKDSVGFLLSGTFGAIFNIILNWLLIPLIGIYGAAFATCVSYILVFIFRAVHTKKYIIYNIFTKEFIVGSIGLVISAFILYLDNWVAQIIQILLFICIGLYMKDVWLLFTSMILNKLRKKGNV